MTEKQKGLNLLIIYLIIGEGEERDNLAHLIRDNDLRDKVFLLGRIENAYKYIKASDVFVLPSRTEAFPYVLLESGLAGACVLASSVGGIPEVVEDDYNGVLFDVNSENDIVHKVNMLLEGGKMRGVFGKRVQEKVVKEFGLDGMVENTTNIYN